MASLRKQTSVLINSSSFEFFIILTKENQFTVYGSHCDGDDDKKIYKTLDTAEQVADLIRQCIQAMFQFSIIQTDDSIFGGKTPAFDIVFHQVFDHLDVTNRTTLINCIDLLRNY